MSRLGYCKCCRENVSDEATNCPHCGQPNPYSYNSYDEELYEIIQSKGEIEAIKRYREITGCGLAEAKKHIDSLDDSSSFDFESTGETCASLKNPF